MENLINSLCDRPNYSIEQLTIKDADILQTLYDRNRDFALLTYGKPFSPTAARDEFEDLPPGKTAEDINVFGLFNLEHSLIGAIVAVKNYPDKQTWWIGLMMLTPRYRNKGLGTNFYQAFEDWLLSQGVRQISLCAIAPNFSALKFWHKMGFNIIRTIPSKQFGIKTHKVYVFSRSAIAKNSTISYSSKL